MLDDPRHGYDLVPAHDEWPGLALRAWDLGVDEHVLNLPGPAGETVAGLPSSHFETGRARGDAPCPPAHRSVELDRPALEPDAVVFAHRLDAVTEVDAHRADRRGQQLGERRRQRLAHVQRAQDVLVGSGMQLTQERQDSVADQAALRVGVARVVAVEKAALLAPGPGLLPPEREQRVHDAV